MSVGLAEMTACELKNRPPRSPKGRPRGRQCVKVPDSKPGGGKAKIPVQKEYLSALVGIKGIAVRGVVQNRLLYSGLLKKDGTPDRRTDVWTAFVDENGGDDTSVFRRCVLPPPEHRPPPPSLEQKLEGLQVSPGPAVQKLVATEKADSPHHQTKNDPTSVHPPPFFL